MSYPINFTPLYFKCIAQKNVRICATQLFVLCAPLPVPCFALFLTHCVAPRQVKSLDQARHVLFLRLEGLVDAAVCGEEQHLNELMQCGRIARLVSQGIRSENAAASDRRDLTVLDRVMALEHTSEDALVAIAPVYGAVVGGVVQVLAVHNGERSCMLVGDEIIAIDGTPVTGFHDFLVSILMSGVVGSTCRLTVQRAGEHMTFDVNRETGLGAWMSQQKHEHAEHRAELEALDTALLVVGNALASAYGNYRHSRTAQPNQTTFELKGLDESVFENVSVLAPLTSKLMDMGLTAPFRSAGKPMLFLPPEDLVDPVDLVQIRAWADSGRSCEPDSPWWRSTSDMTDGSRRLSPGSGRLPGVLR